MDIYKKRQWIAFLCRTLPPRSPERVDAAPCCSALDWPTLWARGGAGPAVFPPAARAGGYRVRALP